MSANPPVFTGKRKRAVVSYKEPDDLVELESESDSKEPAAKTTWDDEGDTDDDEDFSTRRKVCHLIDLIRCTNSLLLTSPQKSTTKAPPRKKAKLVKKPTKEKSFRFLDLPAELRDMIYEKTLADANGVGIVAAQAGHRHVAIRGEVFTEQDLRYRPYSRFKQAKQGAIELAPISTSFVPALLAVNKQVNAEGINYLYGQNFIFKDTTALHSFLAPIGTRNQQRLENIEVMAWGQSGVSKGNNHAAFTLLAAATNLKSLRIRCNVSYSSNSPKRIANRVFKEAHWFLDAYGVANGRKDAAVDILELDTSNFKTFIWDTEPEDAETKIKLFKKALSALLGVKTSRKSHK